MATWELIIIILGGWLFTAAAMTVVAVLIVRHYDRDAYGDGIAAGRRMELARWQTAAVTLTPAVLMQSITGAKPGR